MEEYLQANQMMSLLRPVAYFSLKLFLNYKSLLLSKHTVLSGDHFFQQLEEVNFCIFMQSEIKNCTAFFSILYSALRPGENNDFSTANEKFKDITKFGISQIA